MKTIQNTKAAYQRGEDVGLKDGTYVIVTKASRYTDDYGRRVYEAETRPATAEETVVIAARRAKTAADRAAHDDLIRAMAKASGNFGGQED
jgi:hypothetical protein